MRRRSVGPRAAVQRFRRRTAVLCRSLEALATISSVHGAGSRAHPGGRDADRNSAAAAARPGRHPRAVPAAAGRHAHPGHVRDHSRKPPPSSSSSPSSSERPFPYCWRIDLLRCRNDTQVMLGMLEVVFRRDRIAARLRVTGELAVFLGNMLRGAAHLHVRPVGFVAPREWIGTLCCGCDHACVDCSVLVSWMLFDLHCHSMPLSLAHAVAIPSACAIVTLRHPVPCESLAPRERIDAGTGCCRSSMRTSVIWRMRPGKQPGSSSWMSDSCCCRAKAHQCSEKAQAQPVGNLIDSASEYRAFRVFGLQTNRSCLAGQALFARKNGLIRKPPDCTMRMPAVISMS